MSWIQQETRRRQGAWVSSMPAPALVGYARARAQACPLVGLVGACCSGCAEGKGCAAKDDPHVHAAIQARVGAEGLPMSVVTSFDAEVQHLNADIGGQGGPATQAAWAGFYPAWNAWYADAKAATKPFMGFGFDFIAGEALDQFNALAQQYNLILTKAAEGGVKTSAKPYDAASPFEKALGKGAEAAATATLETLKWIAIAGGVGLLLYFGGPVLITRLARGKK